MKSEIIYEVTEEEEEEKKREDHNEDDDDNGKEEEEEQEEEDGDKYKKCHNGFWGFLFSSIAFGFIFFRCILAYQFDVNTSIDEQVKERQ